MRETMAQAEVSDEQIGDDPTSPGPYGNAGDNMRLNDCHNFHDFRKLAAATPARPDLQLYRRRR